MQIQLAEVKERDQVMIPSFTIEATITGIYTDMKRVQMIIEQLKKTGYTHRINEGHYPYLNVEETFKFYMDLGHCEMPLETMMTLFGFQHQRTTKVGKLTESAKNCLSFLRPFLYTKDLLIIEEPLDRLDEEDRQVIIQLIQQMATEQKTILLLSSNLEELLFMTDDIYRIDNTGFHKMDFSEEVVATTSVEEPSIKIEKIQTKHNDKTILFNPPEIDYIESVEGTVYVNVAGTSYSCALTLNELEKRLRAYGFYRCHRSYIVNLQKVREIITWTKNSYSLKLSVQEGVVIPLSRARLTELKGLLGIL